MRGAVRPAAVFLPLLFLLAVAAHAASRDDEQPGTEAPAPQPVWSLSPSVYTYVLPHGRSYANPNFAADRGRLHLEARYDYEDLDTGSLWLGYNLSWGTDLALGLTPMLGGVVGHTTGVAPGYLVSAGWRGIAFSGQGEYLVDTTHRGDSFFYTWTELSEAPVDWARFGLVIQRTKVYAAAADIQRGVLVGFSYEPVEFTTYVLGIGQGAPTIVFGLAAEF
jgi:hypothetical protein